MAWFSKKEERYLGVDIGAGGMKMVELLFEHGRYKLMTYGATERAADAVDTPITDNPEEAAAHVKELVKQSDARATTAVASLPMHAVFSSIIAIPKVKRPEETRALVERQAAKLMPMPLADMVIDFQVLEDIKKGFAKPTIGIAAPSPEMAGLADENVRVLITGAQKTMVQTYTKLFQSTGLDLVSLETEPFGLIRSLIGRDKSPIMMLDIGAFRTNMIIVEEGVPFLTRSIKVGGAMVTREIARQMGLLLEEAEQVKQDLAATQEATPKAVVDLFQPIVNEIRYAIDLFSQSQLTHADRIEKVILTGGSALLPGLDMFLTDKLNVPTFVGDPWAQVQVNEAMRPVLEEIGPKYAVAIGLAMHTREAAKPIKNAKKDKKEKTGSYAQGVGATQ